jgi:hypothetical protein
VWRLKYEKLYRYVLLLRKLLVENNISVPEITFFNDESATKK